jgi:L-ascorbate metabolism protein UlaG (beta-lactamase superfamily)
MKVKKADDYQSWYVQEGNRALLIDPWFDSALVDGKGWFLQRRKEKKTELSQEEISAVQDIIITAPFEDHLHLKTLKDFPMANIWCSSQVKKILLKKKLENKILELSSDSQLIGNLNVQALPAGFPYNTTAHCLLISNKNGFKVFHEGHVVNKKLIIENNIEADVAILTGEEVKFFGLMTLSMNTRKAIEACKLLKAKKLFITGSNPLKNSGFINNFLKLKKMDNDALDNNIEVFYDAGSTLSS